MDILLLGPQGSGKGTQAKLISQTYGIPQVATGDMIREMKERDTELGRELKEIYDRGDLVDDALMIRLIADRLDRVLTRLTLPGSIYLAAVAVLPSLFIRYGGFSQATSRALGGTSVLIVVGVALDTMRQMESQMMMRSYEGFLK